MLSNKSDFSVKYCSKEPINKNPDIKRIMIEVIKIQV